MKESYQTYWRKLASGRLTGLAYNLVLLLLTPWAWLYGSALRLRAALYRSGMLKTRRLPRPVVSIGNITVGGVSPGTGLTFGHTEQSPRLPFSSEQVDHRYFRECCDDN